MSRVILCAGCLKENPNLDCTDEGIGWTQKGSHSKYHSDVICFTECCEREEIYVFDNRKIHESFVKHHIKKNGYTDSIKEYVSKIKVKNELLGRFMTNTNQ